MIGDYTWLFSSLACSPKIDISMIGIDLERGRKGGEREGRGGKGREGGTDPLSEGRHHPKLAASRRPPGEELDGGGSRQGQARKGMRCEGERSSRYKKGTSREGTSIYLAPRERGTRAGQMGKRLR